MSTYEVRDMAVINDKQKPSPVSFVLSKVCPEEDSPSLRIRMATAATPCFDVSQGSPCQSGRPPTLMWVAIKTTKYILLIVNLWGDARSNLIEVSK